MGHYCRICGCNKPNEKFSGKGHKNHVCKDCSRRPKDEIEEIEQEDEIFGFMKQSNISKKNIARLNELKLSSSKRIAELASITLEVAIVKPHKKRRLKILAKEHRELFIKVKESGLIYAHHC
ncbi:MAG: hypothetical protein P8166_10870 [Candidatus Thiodiazotropha sp.]|jgi:hypothetical protein